MPSAGAQGGDPFPAKECFFSQLRSPGFSLLLGLLLKGGDSVSVIMIRDLAHVVDRKKADRNSPPLQTSNAEDSMQPVMTEASR